MSFIIFPGVITPPLTPGAVPYGTGSTVLMTTQGVAGQVLVSQGSNPPIWGAGAGSFDAIASGTLTDGSTVIVNSNGTVSVVATSTTPTPTVGTVATFEAAATDFTSIVYDSAADKIVIFYRDVANSNYGTAIVGTVTGTTLTFGTPVVFFSADAQYIKACYDSTNSKCVVTYGSGLIAGSANVGTVSGTSISFGARANIYGGAATTHNNIAYNSVNNTVIIIFRDQFTLSNSQAVIASVSGTNLSILTTVQFTPNLMTTSTITVLPAGTFAIFYYNLNTAQGAGVIGTYSGTLTFGSTYTIGSISQGEMGSCYDPVNAQIILSYQTSGTTGAALAATVTGTVISYGTAYVFETNVTNYTAIAYYTPTNQPIISYNDSSGSVLRAIPATVVGSVITYGTKTTIAAATTAYVQSVYDPISLNIVNAYRNASTTFGQSVTYSPVTQTTNLTTGNFIGFSDGNYTNGQTATIQTVGSVDDAQSGLTPGSAYYVANNGALSTTPGTPSVFAGTAVSATEILVKG